MNREIKFRGKSVDNGEWVYGDLMHNAHRNERASILYVPRVIDFPGQICNVPIIKDTICQFTGLHDSDGKDIYEGDILRFQVPDGTIRHFVIEWADEDRILRPLSDFVPDGNPIRISGWCFNWNGYRLYPTVIDGVPDNEVMEVVGNIHDNPELLKQQRQ